MTSAAADRRRELDRTLVEAMFRELDRREEVLESESVGSSDTEYTERREELGLPRYRFDPAKVTSTVADFPVSGDSVRFLFIDPKRAEYVDSVVANEVPTREAGSIVKPRRVGPVRRSPCTICDPRWWDKDCAGRGLLCSSPVVHHHVSLDGFLGVLTRNRHPYARRHGLVRSERHEKQEHWADPTKLRAALVLARALGSQFEVWIAGRGFNTVEHFHVQFRQERALIWEQLRKRSTPPGTVASFPSRPTYLTSADLATALALLVRQLGPDPDVKTARGLMMRYESNEWRMLLVESKSGDEYAALGKKRLGLLEHLGEVILDSQVAAERIAGNRLSEIVQGLEEELRSRAL